MNVFWKRLNRCRAESSPGRKSSTFALVLSALLALVAAGAFAQTPLNDLIFTAGTTLHDGSGQDWSYLVIGSPQPDLLRGKAFAVYGKAGLPGAGGTFALRAQMAPQTSAGSINTLLTDSVPLGEDLAGLSQTLDALMHQEPAFTNQPLAQKVLIAMQRAETNTFTAQFLPFLGRTHPGLNRCLGQAFAEMITGITTYEIREVLPDGATGDVVGRVTITPNAPVVLPAPGKPFQVVTNHPSDDLRIRLRWGTPDTFRRLALLGYGFNVWRIRRTNAENAGFNLTPPTILQLYTNGNFLHVNDGPVLATRSYNTNAIGAGSAADTADPATSFFADDNHRHDPGGQAFNDGDEFYYFITARDLLGRDGFVSAGGLAKACRRLAPAAPKNVDVRDLVQVVDLGGGNFTNQQRLLVSWTQNTNAADGVGSYWIYRWPNPSMAFTNDPSATTYRVGIVPQIPGTNFNSYMDTNTTAPLVPGSTSYWYTVRAVAPAACVSLFSPHSAPAWGVLRERAAPDAGSGEVVGSCGNPSAIFIDETEIDDPSLDTNLWHYRFTCDRLDRGVAFATFYFTNHSFELVTLGPVYFPPDGDHVEVDYEEPNTGFFDELDYTCEAGSYAERVSPRIWQGTFTEPAAGKRFVGMFQAGLVLLTGASANDPLLTQLPGQNCYNPTGITVDPSGTLALLFLIAPGTPLLIQASTNNGATWNDAGFGTTDASGLVYLSYPACLVGPLPTFRGCTVPLPSEGNCDQHIARASDNGPVAPIQIRFRLTPRTREYRIYRQINDGPLALLSQGPSPYVSASRTYVRLDESMPATPARFCYYLQLLDENGNASPMTLLGCKEVKPTALPRPILSEPSTSGTITNPLVTLNWFCPTTGVKRFQVTIHRTDDPAPNNPSGLLSAFLKVNNLYKKNVIYYGLKAGSLISTFTEAQYTPTLSSGFGPGPQFSLTATVIPNAHYEISVAAVDSQDHAGPLSEVQDFIWRTPPPLVLVPWPARPLPLVHTFDDLVPQPASDPRVKAIVFTNGFGVLQDQQYPVGIMIGFHYSDSQVHTTVGTTNLVNVFGDPNPLYLFRRQSNIPSRSGNALLPIIVYREQIANANYPVVSGDVTQVTPLIEAVPWRSDTGDVPDLLFAIYNDALMLRDLQPVLVGARYRYFVMQMKPNREIDQVIPAGDVTIPGTP